MRRKELILLISSLSVIIAILISFVVYKANNRFWDRGKEAEILLEQWDNALYLDVLEETQVTLKDYFFDPVALYLAGASSFYLALSQLTEPEKEAYLDLSIVYLNRLLTLDMGDDSIERVYYLLGQVLTHKGYYYADEAVYYLKKVPENVQKTPDLNEYLGINYDYLRQTKESLFYLKKIPVANRNSKIKEKIEQLEREL